MNAGEVWCALCSESFPADAPMVEFDGEIYCSPQCVAEYLDGGIDPSCMSREGWLAATQSFYDRLSRLVQQTESNEG